MFQEADISERSAMDAADHKGAHKRLPARDKRKMPVVATLKDPNPGNTRGLFIATAAVLNFNAVSRAMATIAVRWLRIPRLGYFGDFGAATAASKIQAALPVRPAFTELGEIFGFEPKTPSRAHSWNYLE